MSGHNISDEKWAIIGPVLANSTEARCRKRKDDRLMFDAVLLIIKTGAPWRDLHPEFGTWKTAHERFPKRARLEAWDGVLQMLPINAEPEALIIDAAFISLCQRGAGAKGGASIRRA